MSRTSTTVAPSLQAYFLETSSEALDRAKGTTDEAVIAPWTGRKLRHALADLGPVRPVLQPEAIAEIAAAGIISRPLPPPMRPMRLATDDDVARAAESVALAPADIVRALAETGPQPMTFAPVMPQHLSQEAFERPPMIIERAHAERELRAGAPLVAPAWPNPLPALATGFAMALLTGAGLYYALVGV